MGSAKYRIRQLIKPVDERNCHGIKDFYGININKEFMPTVANTDGLDERGYKVVRKNRFVFSGMQTGRDACIRLGLYLKDAPVIVSPAYTTFEIEATELILPVYFFMIFLSGEKDRLGWFYSDGSIRSNLDWDRFCEIELELPDIPTQQRYVNIYNALLANQQSYEQGLEELKLSCDACVENLRRELPREKIGPYISESSQRNSIGLGLDAVRGLATNKEIISTKADMSGVSLDSYKVVAPGQIAYVPDTSRRGDKISLGFNDTDKAFLVSSISIVFGTDSRFLLPEYLMLFLTRAEFDRYARFNSWGSARETFDWGEMCGLEIPRPDLRVQKAIAEIYAVYRARKRINERLKAQIKEICPILIRGSLENGGQHP